MSHTGVLSVFSPRAALSSTSWSPGAAATEVGRGAVVVESAAALASASAVTIRRIMVVFTAAMRLCSQCDQARCASLQPRRRPNWSGKATPFVRGLVLAVLARLVHAAATSRRARPTESSKQSNCCRPSAGGSRSAVRRRIDSSSGSQKRPHKQPVGSTGALVPSKEERPAAQGDRQSDRAPRSRLKGS